MRLLALSHNNWERHLLRMAQARGPRPVTLLPPADGERARLDDRAPLASFVTALFPASAAEADFEANVLALLET